MKITRALRYARSFRVLLQLRSQKQSGALPCGCVENPWRVGVWDFCDRHTAGGGVRVGRLDAAPGLAYKGRAMVVRHSWSWKRVFVSVPTTGSGGGFLGR